ncbi:protein YIPF3-like [Anthonomus grandis grandis]|uniref:protein YIPF3-like n=1 Tax=Anthonomus grandis grandis TaxID=2921223 RepID=UPI002165EB62|nr:protein YIPF3-like [Anthonomus grandis grandis]
MSSRVIFIGSPVSSGKNYRKLFSVSVWDLYFRIFASFMPPFGAKYRRVYVDLIGPLLAWISLTVLLTYGNLFKNNTLSPVKVMIIYGGFMPVFCYGLAKLGKSGISFLENLSLVGYSLYGHLYTLLISFVLFRESSNSFFFLSMIVFGGLSSLRLILVFLKTIPVPGVRLLVCSSIALVNILFLIYLHFSFMHRNVS